MKPRAIAGLFIATLGTRQSAGTSAAAKQCPPFAVRPFARKVVLLLLSLACTSIAMAEPAITPFSAGSPGAVLPSPWRVATLPGGKRPTRFDLVADGDTVVLRAEAHASVASVVHPLAFDPNAFLAQYQATLNRIVYDSVHKHQGSISAEHGLGQLKVDDAARYKSPIEIALMRAVKSALDPLALMNPGKVLR